MNVVTERGLLKYLAVHRTAPTPPHPPAPHIVSIAKVEQPRAERRGDRNFVLKKAPKGRKS